jgi:capsular polysaccharide transport system permease protein
VLEPVAAVLVLTAALSMVVHAPSLGTSFVVFYASGYLPFLFYATLQGHVQQALSTPVRCWFTRRSPGSMRSRDAFVLNTVTGLTVVVHRAGRAGACDGGGPDRRARVDRAVACSGGVLGLGLGRAELPAGGPVPALGSGLGHSLAPLFLVAGVIFVMEDLPPGLQDWLFLTPWIHITGLFRAGLYAGYEAAYASSRLCWSGRWCRSRWVGLLAESTGTRSCRPREGGRGPYALW